MRLKGLGVSPGIGVGRALVLKRATRELRFRVPEALVGRELQRLDEARARSREQLQHIKSRMVDSAGADHAYLFDAQLLMLDDAMLIERTASIIRQERLNAESALQRALEQISTFFEQVHDAYLRERKGDVADVVGRICMNLRAAGDPADLFNGLEGPLVLVADEITPSVIAQLDWSRLAALVTDAGSWTYHTAILARSIRVPAVAGLHNASTVITPGANLAVDGATGEVVIDPDEQTLAQIATTQRRREAYRAVSRRVPPSRGGDRGRGPDPARSERRSASRRGEGPRTRRRGDRPLSFRVPARRRRPGRTDRGFSILVVPSAPRERRRRPRDRAHVRHQRTAAADRARGN